MRRIHNYGNGVNSFSSVDLRDSYLFSVGCVSSHEAIFWNTDSGTASSA